MTKIGFISDIHGNIDALQAVLAKLDQCGCDMVFCLGDIVGYGAGPSECIKLIREREIPSVMGNHDEYVTLLMDPRVEKLREEIREAIYWCQGKLSMDELRWLAKLPMRIETEEFTVLHGSFHTIKWAYCLDEPTFAANFKMQTMPLAFCGHSHSPLLGIEVPNDIPYVDYIRKTIIKPDLKYMINVGAVGQPRDRDPRACAVIYNLASRELELIRVEYDIAAAQARIRAAGLPEKFARRLQEGR
ncbi:MAG: metallophosphoesterase family protein [Lentisphaerae bacterium]|nr:metallophosphoesterase family protein [Lentisphaerota bacterium]